MILGYTRRLRLAGLLALGACSAQVAATPLPEPPATVASDAEGQALRFDTENTLRLKPGAYTEIAVLAPPHVGSVRLALEGAYEDASVSAATLSVALGRASATLRAPGVPATFVVRAAADGAREALLRVAVSAQGFGTLRVVPRYAGKRSAATLYASVIVDRACAELAHGDVKDGSPVDVGGSGRPIVLTDVPAEGHLAVQARVLRYAVGCVDLDRVVAGAEREVTVDVRDVSLDLTRAVYTASLALEPGSAGASSWARLAEAAAASATDAFVPPASDEGRLWLDTLRDRVVPAGALGALDASRASGGWDAKVATWLAARPPSLRSRASAWLAAGKADVRWPLEIVVAPSPAAAGRALVTPATFGPFPAPLVKIAARGEFAWKADPDDTVHLAGKLALLPSELAAAAADGRARLEVPAAPHVPDALAAQLDVAGLASSLVGSGTAYPQCGAACLTAHLVGGLAAMWSDAREASQAAGEEVHLSIAASARAGLDDLPRPERFTGTWLGDMTALGEEFPMKGAVTGARKP